MSGQPQSKAHPQHRPCSLGPHPSGTSLQPMISRCRPAQGLGLQGKAHDSTPVLHRAENSGTAHGRSRSHSQGGRIWARRGILGWPPCNSSPALLSAVVQSDTCQVTLLSFALHRDKCNPSAGNTCITAYPRAFCSRSVPQGVLPQTGCWWCSECRWARHTGLP